MTTISLKVLYDLKDRLDDMVDPYEVLKIERAVLDWAEANGLLPVYDTGPHGRKVIIETELPADPQAAAEPDGESALTGAAVVAEVDSSDGAEGTLPPEDAPVPPVAGGGTSSPKAAPPVADDGTSLQQGAGAEDGSKLGLVWTDEEDARAIAMKVDGASNQDIAEALGRTKAAASYRLSAVLKRRLDAAREAATTARAEDAPEAGEPPATTDGSDSEPAAERDAADRGGDDAVSPAQAVAAPPFDPARPLWWREIDAHLNSLGYRAPFDPELDLELVERLTEGSKLAEIAADLGIDAARLKERWVAILNGEKPTIEMQGRLCEVLRHRSAMARLSAAE